MSLSYIKMICDLADQRSKAPYAPTLYRGQPNAYYISSLSGPDIGKESIFPSAFRPMISDLEYRIYYKKEKLSNDQIQDCFRSRHWSVAMAQNIMAIFLEDVMCKRVSNPLQVERFFGSWDALITQIPALLQHYGLWGLSTDFSSDIRVALSFAFSSINHYPAYPILYEIDVQRLLDNLHPRFQEVIEPNELWVLMLPSKVESRWPRLTIMDLTKSTCFRAERVHRQKGFFVNGLHSYTIWQFTTACMGLSKQVLSVENEDEKEKILDYLGEQYRMEYFQCKDDVYHALFSLYTGHIWKDWYDMIIQMITSQVFAPFGREGKIKNPLYGMSKKELFELAGFETAFQTE